jgi:hypothetical protein
MLKAKMRHKRIKIKRGQFKMSVRRFNDWSSFIESNHAEDYTHQSSKKKFKVIGSATTKPFRNRHAARQVPPVPSGATYLFSAREGRSPHQFL